MPSMTWRSERQTPAAAMRTRTSPACGSPSSTSSTLSGAPDSHSTAAFVRMPGSIGAPAAVGCAHEPEAGRGTRRADRHRRRVRLRAEQAGRRLAHGHEERHGAAGGLPDRSPPPRSRARRSTARTFSLARLQGKPVFINFWGSWCEPCKTRGARPARVRGRARRSRRRSSAWRSTRRTATRVAFARKAGWRYPIVSTRCCGLSNRYGVVGMPTTIVVDGDGPGRRPPGRPADASRGCSAELRALGA